MPLDPHFQPMLDLLASMPDQGLETMSPVQAREMFKAMSVDEGEPTPVASVSDRTIAGRHHDVPVRVYRPDGEGPFGVLVWLHGGGWVIGDLDTADGTARALCARAGMVVVSVDYGLAPEHPAPQALDDCWDTVQWVVEHADEMDGDPARVAVGGDSAGGNLAAVVAQRAAAEGRPRLALQVLVYPVTDLTIAHPSYEENGEGYFLTRASMIWFIAHYLSGGADAHDPAVSPLFADDVSQVAPAVVITAEYDPLRDEGNAYAAKLEAAGVPVQAKCFDGMIHGFFGMRAVTPVADDAIDMAAQALREAMSSVEA